MPLLTAAVTHIEVNFEYVRFPCGVYLLPVEINKF